MQPNHEIEMRFNVKTPVRDGVELSSDIYLPAASGKFPTILMRTPYDNNAEAMIEKGRRLANNGYACVIQDVRGRWDSDGVHYALFNHAEDGFDTQEWIGNQDWSDGTIGMAGGSYVGWVQWQSAVLRNRHLKCLAPRVMCGDLYTGLIHPGGAFQLNVALTWGMRTNGRTAQSIEFHNWTEAFRTVPLINMDQLAGRDLQFWKDWVTHTEYDEYWDTVNIETKWDQINVPALVMGGWYDLYAKNTFINFNGLRLNGGTDNSRQSRLIVGPWPHALSVSTKTGDVDFGVNSMVDLETLELRWFDYWMKGLENGVADEAPLRLFIMGINEWRDEYEWPLARTVWQKWYLHSSGNANTLTGDGVLTQTKSMGEPPDRFTYDPDNPVQTVGGNNCCSPHIVPWGPYDQRGVEMRSDVLCYTTDRLEDEIEVTGPIKLVLFAATDGLDTDWTVKLVDVSDSGYAKNLCDGIIRGRYRNGFRTAALLEANTIYRYEIDLGVTGNVFKKGHRIRVEVSSSNFPRFDRNHNTGNNLGTDIDMRVAHQIVLHDGPHPSHIILPVIPLKD